MVTLPYFTDANFDWILVQHLIVTSQATAIEQSYFYRAFPCLVSDETRRVQEDKRYRFFCWFSEMCGHWNAIVSRCTQLDHLAQQDPLAENDNIIEVAHAVLQLEALTRSVKTQIAMAEYLAELGPMGTVPSLNGRHISPADVKLLARSLERTSKRLNKLFVT